MLSSTMTKRSKSTPRRVPIENVSEGESCGRRRSGSPAGRGAAEFTCADIVASGRLVPGLNTCSTRQARAIVTQIRGARAAQARTSRQRWPPSLISSRIERGRHAVGDCHRDNGRRGSQQVPTSRPTGGRIFPGVRAAARRAAGGSISATLHNDAVVLLEVRSGSSSGKAPQQRMTKKNEVTSSQRGEVCP